MIDYYDTPEPIKVCITLRPCEDETKPKCVLTVNNIIQFDNKLEESKTFVNYVNLLDPISIDIKLHGKSYNASPESGLFIDMLDIDDFKIVHQWTHLATYINDKNYNEPTTHLGFNGVWSIKMDRPFYQWQHVVTNQGWLLQP